MSVTPQQIHNGRRVLTTAEASAKSGLSRSHIHYLVRTGKIEGSKPWGRDWMIYEDSLQAFLAQPRSPGREGPRKKRIEQGGRVLLSTSEAHECYGYVKDTLLRLLRSSRIEGEKHGRQWLIYEDSLIAYANRQGRKHLKIVESTLVDSEKPLSESKSSPGE